MGFSSLSFYDFSPYPDLDPKLKSSYFCMCKKGLQLPDLALELVHELKLAGDDAIPVNAKDFYKDLFQDDLQEKASSPGEYKKGEYSGIFVDIEHVVDKDGKPVINQEGRYKGHPRVKSRNRLFFRGNKELLDRIDRSDNFIITNGISYVGDRRLQKNAAKMYAMAIEIDGVKGWDGVRQLIHSWHRPLEKVQGKYRYTMTPKPTYIACSGRGLHLYFVFEQPIHLYPNIFEELSRVRKHWIDLFWNSRVTYLHEPGSIQYETLTQGFRAIGSKTRLDDTYVLAFKTGEKHSIESFNEILSDENKISLGYKSTLTREEAKKLYPEWYQRRIVEGKPKKSGSMIYYRHRGIYDNWKEKILEGAIVGKRYFCLENLCSLAVQCQISPEEIEKDCRTIMMSFENLTNDDKNHFTMADVSAALSTYYRADYKAFSRKIEYVSERTGIPLPRAKRNGRTQIQHLRRARAVLELDREELVANGAFANVGRPSKATIVQGWRRENPRGRKIDCHRETGLSRPTIDKYW